MGLKHKTTSGKPRLLIVLNRFVIGGQAVDTIPLAYSLAADFEILILYGEKEADEIEPTFLLAANPGLQLKKISHLRRSINPLIDAIAFHRLLYTFLKYKPHIVHTHGAKSGFLGRLAAWLCNVPVIIHTFHGHFFHSYFSKYVSNLISGVERTIGKITTAAIALSETQKEELTHKFKIMPASKIAIIPLGFAFDNNQSADSLRFSFRNKYGLKEEDVAIGIVGRIVPVKNHVFFVHVVKNILEAQNKKAAFFIVGDGELRTNIEGEFSKHGISYNNTSITATNRVVFTSWITNMYEVMNGLDIIALTSLNEGTPLSIIEAQFFRKTVVSTNVGGVKDTMEDRKTGFLVEEGNLHSFCNNLELLVNNRDLRLQMGEAGNQFATERFAKNNEVANTRNFYFSLLHRKGHAFSNNGPNPYSISK